MPERSRAHVARRMAHLVATDVRIVDTLRETCFSRPSPFYIGIVDAGGITLEAIASALVRAREGKTATTLSGRGGIRGKFC